MKGLFAGLIFITSVSLFFQGVMRLTKSTEQTGIGGGSHPIADRGTPPL